MSRLATLSLRLRALLDRRSVESELDDELRFHIEREIADRVRRGIPPEEARRTALRDFGGVERFKEECRDERGTRPLEEVVQDTRFGFRALRKHPGFTAVVILTLALGIGANTAIFSVVNGVLLRPLPYDRPDDIVRLRPMADGRFDAASPIDYLDWRDGSRSFEALALFQGRSMNLTGDGDPERIVATRATANLFRVLRQAPVLGRTFAPGEDQPAAQRVAIISDGFWRSRFGADSSVLGRMLHLDGDPYTVVGVAPKTGEYPAGSDVWIPMVFDEDELRASNRASRSSSAIGRLRAGVSLERAQEDVSSVARRLEAMYPNYNTGVSIRLTPLHEVLVGDLRTPLLILLGAVGLVLLIACANVANLFLVRGTSRAGEMAVRTALGAGRGRLLRQLITESLLLSLLGGAAGFVLALWGTRVLSRLGSDVLPRLGEARVDGVVLLFTAAVTLLTGVLFGIMPARHAAPRDLAASLRAGARGSREKHGARRTRNAIVVAEVSLAVMLLAGAGLLIRSFQRLLAVDPGFRAENVISFTVALPEARYESEQSLRDFFSTFTDRLRTLPGASAVGLISHTPVSWNDFAIGFSIAGRPPARPGEALDAQVRVVDPHYFRAMGVPLLRGRALDERDRAGAPRVVLVNAAFARQFFAAEEPLGKEVQLGWSRDSVRQGGTIAGIVGDVRQFALERESVPEIYLPIDQTPMARMTVVVRTTSDPASIHSGARDQLRALDANLPLYGIGSMEQALAESVSRPRFYTLLLGIFAAVALLLAAVGLYGVIAFAVAQRTHEIGIRIALGATRERVLKSVVGDGLRLATFGIAIGVSLSLATTRLLRTLLYGVTPSDPLTFAAVGIILIAVASLACYMPARRAARVDPTVAMRAE